jgi:hypothetical protein
MLASGAAFDIAFARNRTFTLDSAKRETNFGAVI